MATLTEEDEGKRVVNEAGDELGRITSVEHGEAFVDPDPGLTDRMKASLGWDEADQEDFRLDAQQVEEVTDDEVRVA